MAILEIKNLKAKTENQEILQGLDLVVRPGEIHAIMGPNGAGKSTLSKVLAGHPDYLVTGGSVTFLGEDLLEMSIEQRALKGLFIGFQYPVEIPGVSNFDFYFAAYTHRQKERGEESSSKAEFRVFLLEVARRIDMNPLFVDRDLNDGFSGGEKKKNEILQMLLFSPKLAVLDETDSGLDIDAMKTIAKGIKESFSKEKGLVLITHYQRLLDYIQPDFVHVMMEGSIVKTGNFQLAKTLEESGYDAFEKGKEKVGL
ncbi:Fe-S cluster assembly ATPase SufC [Candidatus Aerophobetes bacterium]|uniref:Fe-S cluster assembly ATPase SufC n=1 Tax=Aerophobetes bacterium TaxID=2030807 RepID=A0A2A4X5R4_UNCAE|nr:MAG: Fe-S cluster assembly ATPase SufC [Candidatus Aerophobetes bacterium]